MANEKKQPQAEVRPAESPAETPAEKQFPLTLDEFCTQLSQSDKRVELIGGFHHVERKHGRVRDTESAFRARFEAFVKAPA